MNDTIYRQDAIDALDKEYRCTDKSDDWDGLETAMLIIENLPSAHPEQKIGKFVRWMEKRETPKYISYTPHCKCSLCGNELLIESIKYCYICGARLIEDRCEERRKDDE